MAKQYQCDKSKTGACEHGGNKAYNYGFMSGTAQFCRHKKDKRWVADIDVCPKERFDSD